MSFYGVLLILLPISMAGVLAMPGHHHKPTPHRRPHHHRHSQDHSDHLSARHHIRHPHLKQFDDDELNVLSLEEPLNEQKRDQRHSEDALPFVLEEDGLENRFKAACGYTVEVVPCTGNSCTKQYLRHIKCNHTGHSHGNGYCIQTFRKVKMNCNGSSENSTHLYTGCVFATQNLIKGLPSTKNDS